MTTEEQENALEILRNIPGVEPAAGPALDGWWPLVCRDPESERILFQTLYREQAFWCDLLVSISGSHVREPVERFRVTYHVESLVRGWKFAIVLERQAGDVSTPRFSSIADIWKAALWHERETAELYGIDFLGHPDLRKLLLPADWEGFPLRKDYVAQEKYHGLKIRYERSDFPPPMGESEAQKAGEGNSGFPIPSPPENPSV